MRNNAMAVTMDSSFMGDLRRQQVSPETGTKLDLWKVMIREDADRFQTEQVERKAQMRATQVHYKSFLDKQMEH